ncbi:MAG: bifunctional hydroxymethylpyrimidine kinase/phosphomethylpyrimidine kinase [Candidatus Nitronauta litoralis]|uniref:hydroxymethylpyrimidine kinase n=1 Tax=Candidatus Nitronauta litoralis TaxID=2705533 RepID=A0A7T0FZ63_9BACT|nr:MAG: bifunctional hydroxymethylpyrimidine kinase/phosphomethylpyrimidine kinase [Candidatus Nitronauta litoralis]
MKTLSTVLTVAGSDPSGGAGLQADLKTIAAHGLFGTSVVTSLTVQNTQGVSASHDIDPEVVAAQIDSLLADEKPAATKTGMLGNEAIVERIAKIFKRRKLKHLVVDPVIQSTNGKELLSRKGVAVMVQSLFPLASLVTPNLKEAEVLSGVPIRSRQDRVKSARAILKLGPKAVLIKGGHSKKDADDLLMTGKTPHWFESIRSENENLHGTGCVLSSAIASNLALGFSMEDSVGRAKEFTFRGIELGVQTGKGVGQVNPMGDMFHQLERGPHLERVEWAIEELKRQEIGELIPEVQSNLGFGLQGAKEPNEVVGIPGRIIRNGSTITTINAPRFGASQHVAKIVLTAMSFDPEKRAVMNIKFQQYFLDACKRLKMTIGSFDRAKEPKNVKQLEGSSLEWGTRQAILDRGYVPDIIFDLGGQGKEEMIRVIAKDVEELVEKIKKIHRAIQKNKAKKEQEAWRKK